MNTNDIYVIEPEYYESYQRTRRQQDRSETLSAVIKMLLLTLFFIILFLSYKIVEKNGYINEFFYEKSRQAMALKSSYIEVPARTILGSTSPFSFVEKQERTVPLVKVEEPILKESIGKQDNKEVAVVEENVVSNKSKILSLDYLAEIQRELNSGI